MSVSINKTNRRHTVNLGGESIAKGRNGFFAPRAAHLVIDDEDVHFAMLSRRKADVGAGPVSMRLTKQDARAIRELFKQVDGGLTKRQYAIASALALIEAWYRYQGKPGITGRADDVIREVAKILKEAEGA